MTISEPYRQYNRIYYQYSELYHEIAAKYGFSDTQYWLLYTLYTDDGPVTQNELAIVLGTSKQTVNSAIAGLKRDGYLELTQRPGPRNGKAVTLTQAGDALCRRCVKPLIEAEERAMAKMPEEETKLFLKIYEKRFALFHNEIRFILEENGQS